MKVSSQTVSERLADYVVGLRYDDLPGPVVEKTKDQLIHHLGAALVKHGSQDGQRAVRVAHALSGTAGGECSIIGEARKATLLESVFANSFLMHSGGLDDWHLPSGAHCGIITHPVAWALGETTHASGRDLLTAVVAGYEVMIRLCGLIWTWSADQPRHPNDVFGPFGGAATGARLFGLSRDQTVDALGHAGQAGMGLVEGGEYPWPINPLLARNGMMSAVLANADMPASPTILEGKHGVFRSFFREIPPSLDASLATIGQDFETTRVQVKRYPTSGLNVVPIELAQQLVTAHELTPGRLVSVEVTLPVEREQREEVREAAMLRSTPNTPSHHGSLRFWIAIAIADGRIESARLHRQPDPDIYELMDKISLRFEAGHPLRYANIEVTTTDGRRHAAAGDSQVLRPPSWTEWLQEGGRAILSEEQLTRLVALIRDLENVPDVAEVTACMTPR